MMFFKKKKKVAGVLRRGGGWIENLSGLSTWLNAVNVIGAGEKIPCVVIGSSIGVGIGATTPATEGYAYVLAAALEARYGAAGGMVPPSVSWTAGTGWSNGVLGIYKSSRHGAAGAAGTLSVTLTGLSFDIHYCKYNNSGAFTAQLDAETPVAMGGVGTGTLTFHKETLTAGASGSHTITITPGAGGIAYITGINVNLSTDGIQINNPSRSGALTSTFYGNSEIGSLDGIQPKLTIIEMTTNDYGTQVALATYEAQLEAMIDKALLYGSCLLVADPWRAGSLTITQASYDAQMRTSATEKGATFLSIPVKWGGYNAGLMNADTVHPNTAGHADMAAAINTYL